MLFDGRWIHPVSPIFSVPLFVFGGLLFVGGFGELLGMEMIRVEGEMLFKGGLAVEDEGVEVVEMEAVVVEGGLGEVLFVHGWDKEKLGI